MRFCLNFPQRGSEKPVEKKGELAFNSLLHSIKDNRRALDALWKKKETKFTIRKREDEEEDIQEAQYLDNIFRCLDEIFLLNKRKRKED